MKQYILKHWGSGNYWIRSSHRGNPFSDINLAQQALGETENQNSNLWYAIVEMGQDDPPPPATTYKPK